MGGIATNATHEVMRELQAPSHLDPSLAALQNVQLLPSRGLLLASVKAYTFGNANQVPAARMAAL